MPGRKDGLGRILDNRQPSSPCNGQQRVHIGSATEKMNGHNRPGALADFAFHVSRIDQVGDGIDISKYWHGSQTGDGTGGSEERIARQYHLVSDLDTKC